MNLDDIDGAIWGVVVQEEKYSEVETTLYRFSDKITPYANEDLGIHKYIILTFKADGSPESIEFMKACVGDVKFFIDNYSKAGYNGLMIKEGCVPKKTIKGMIRAIFNNWQLPDKSLKTILAQV